MSEGNQTISRGSSERASLGLLSRFLGAVFLVLLGGLLLLDRVLLRASRSQATLDAQSAGLLTESFVAMQVGRLDQVPVSVGNRLADSVVSTKILARVAADSPEIRRIWKLDPTGLLLMARSNRDVGQSIPAEILARVESVHAKERLTVLVAPVTARRAVVALLRGTSNGSTTGLLLDSDAIRGWLERTTPETRLTLTVLSGNDTIVFLDRRRSGTAALATGDQVVRLPTGGTWRVVTTHALTSSSLRWTIWSLGILGVGLLGVGLLREQRRVLLVADRSVELERLYSDVKRANQAKSEFLANVSHELRTPLNAIVGFVELLRDGFYGDLSPRQVLPVDRIAASATHLRHLVDQVLDIAKIAAGRLEVHPESIVLRSFVLNIASELESLVSERALAFSITVGASLPRVRTDPTHLRQILINLIGNAVKYTPTGTVSVRARLLGAPSTSNFRRTNATVEAVSAQTLLAQAPRSGTWVALQVVDTGVGIAKRDLERIFDEFEQVNAGPRGDSMHRGTGLGLAISRRLARILGGEISVDSVLGRGATFTVWLPVNPGDLKRETITPPSHPTVGSTV